LLSFFAQAFVASVEFFHKRWLTIALAMIPCGSESHAGRLLSFVIGIPITPTTAVAALFDFCHFAKR